MSQWRQYRSRMERSGIQDVLGKLFPGFRPGYETFSGKDCFTSFAMTVPYFQVGSVPPVNH